MINQKGMKSHILNWIALSGRYGRTQHEINRHYKARYLYHFHDLVDSGDITASHEKIGNKQVIIYRLNT